MALWTSQRPLWTGPNTCHLGNGDGPDSCAEWLSWISRLRQLLAPVRALTEVLNTRVWWGEEGQLSEGREALKPCVYGAP